VSDHFDIVILGGGLNGAALASALKNGPHRVALVEPHPPAAFHPPTANAHDEIWDSRIYAYSPGNVEWLRALGAWGDPVRAQAVYAMKIHGDGAGRLSFDAVDAGLPELAWIAENGRLQSALWQSVLNHPNVTVLPTPATAVTWNADTWTTNTWNANKNINARSHQATQHQLHLQDGRVVSANLLVAADGAHSWLRAQANIGFDEEDYQHIGVVANFACEKAHRGRAFQWFRADGVLAYLPLPGQRISMVWSTPPAQAEVLRSLPPAALAQQVMAAGNGVLGQLRCITPAAGFPLKRRRAHEWVRPGLVLLGDAAHTVHPLAGQGVNLGFRDSRLLAEMLASGGDAGDIGRLTTYAARRREDVVSMQFTTGSLKKLFSHEDRLISALRNWGMSVANQIHPINQALTRHAVL
jgi:ubiquinone biosynthesis UbiH/UbiF/VisC/COQ6 family hydroxylase